MINPADVINWNPNRYYPSDFEKRYAHLEVVAGVDDLDACYSFEYVGVFYDPNAGAYMVGSTSGCSCPSPWDEDVSEMDGYLNRDEAIARFRHVLDESYAKWGTGHVMDAVNAVKNHKAVK